MAEGEEPYVLYFRTRFLLILEIQYFLLFFLFKLQLPRPPENITTFEIPARELYCPVTISGLSRKLIFCKQTTKIKMSRFSRTSNENI
jgi:hypothetical protein